MATTARQLIAKAKNMEALEEAQADEARAQAAYAKATTESKRLRAQATLVAVRAKIRQLKKRLRKRSSKRSKGAGSVDAMAKKYLPF